MQALHGEPEACTGFYTQCGTGLEIQQKIPRAHTGFYTQCGKGLENQRHHDAQAFTLRAAESWVTRENPKSTHRLLHSVWQRAGEPETHDMHRLLHSERPGLGNQRDILSAHTGFYAQCSTGKMEPMEFVHINLYTVMIVLLWL